MTIRAPYFGQKREQQSQVQAVVPNLLTTTLLAVVGSALISEPTFPDIQQQKFDNGTPLTLLTGEELNPFVQHDWPNPQFEIWQDSLTTGRSIVDVPASVKPFSQIEWPNPQTIEIRQDQLFSAFALLNELASVEPFRQIEWPNPFHIIFNQYQQISKSIALIEPASSEPFRQTEWPNPLLEHIEISDQVSKSIALVEPAAESPFAQLDWINPQILERYQVHQIPKSIALTVTIGNPFYQNDWPNPQRVTWQDSLSFGHGIVEELVVGKPFNQFDWPNHHILNRQQTANLGSNMALIDQRFILWSSSQNVQIQQPIILDQMLNVSIILDSISEPNPFFQTEWVIPPGILTQTPLQIGLPLTLLEDAGDKPFNQFDWPNPQVEYSQLPEQINKSIALVEIVVSKPFAQYDWLNPGKINVQQIESLGSNIMLLSQRFIIWSASINQPGSIFRAQDQVPNNTILQTIGEKPFNQLDWITPPGLPIQTPFQVGSPIVLLDTAPPVPPQIRQSDWITPPGLPIQTPFQVSLSLTILEGAGKKPFNQLDWPNPQFEITQQPFQVGVFSLLLVEDKPFALYEWPQPDLIPTLFIDQSSKPFILGEPFFKLDWPNPTVDVKIQTPFQVSAPLTLLEDAGEKPFAQYHWPQPDPIPTLFIEQVPKIFSLETSIVFRDDIEIDIDRLHILVGIQFEPIEINIEEQNIVIGGGLHE